MSGSVAFDVDELLRHPDAALTIGDRVVHLLHQRGPVALEALDHDELPEGTGAVERIPHEQRGQVEQLAAAPGRG